MTRRPVEQAAVLLLALACLLTACGGSSRLPRVTHSGAAEAAGAVGPRDVPSRRYVFERIDPGNAQAVYDWARDACKQEPLQFLAGSQRPPTRADAISHLVAGFPAAARADARRGCRAGFAQR